MTHTCFIFVTHLQNDRCLQVTLDEHGDRVQDIDANTTIAEIASRNARIILVFPGEKASVHHVALPRTTSSKIRLALPYSLEDALAQPIEKIHFVFDKAHYHAGQYMVLAFDKAYVQDTIAYFQTHGIHVDYACVDFFALEPEQACMLEDTLLVSDYPSYGAITQDCFSLCQSDGKIRSCYIFDEKVSRKLPKGFKGILESIDPHLFIAQRLLHHRGMNVCQGLLAQKKTHRRERGVPWDRIMYGMLGMVIFLFLFGNFYTWYSMHHRIAVLDRDMQSMYTHFFPHTAAQDISEDHLKRWIRGHTNEENDTLWKIWYGITGAMQHDGCEVGDIDFEKGNVRMTVLCADFATLSHFEESMHYDRALTIQQVSAQAMKDKVKAILTVRVST